MARTATVRHRPTASLLTVLGAVISICSAVTSSSAATCLEQTQLIARAYRLSIDPPNLDASQPPGSPQAPSSESLARSGGLIEPPAASDPAVINPPERPETGMQTLPETSQDDEPAGTGGLDPSEHAILESILISARAEAKQGREEECFERLAEAKKYIQKTQDGTR